MYLHIFIINITESQCGRVAGTGFAVFAIITSFVSIVFVFPPQFLFYNVIL